MNFFDGLLGKRKSSANVRLLEGISVHGPTRHLGASTSSLGRWGSVRKALGHDEANRVFRGLQQNVKRPTNVPTEIASAVIQMDTTIFVSDAAKNSPEVVSYLSEQSYANAGFVIYYVDEILIAQFRKSLQAKGPASVKPATTETFRMLTTVIGDVVSIGASDLHILVKATDSTALHVRLHGDKLPYKTWNVERGRQALQGLHTAGEQKAVNLSWSVGSSARISEGKISLPDGVEGVRVQFSPTGQDDFYAVLRFLGAGASDAQSIADLGFDPDQEQILREIREYPDGITLITGPTGSGKSKTLKHYLSEMLVETDGKINIITVEDPVEYTIEGAIQTPVPAGENEEETRANYAKVMRQILRLDPDAIVPSEIRDLAAADIAFEAALTGHSVKSTLHVNSALDAPRRLTEMGVDKTLVFNPNICRGFIAQRLAKVLCPDCKMELRDLRAKPSTALQERIRLMVGDGHKVFYKCDDPQHECKTCGSKGILGRTVVAEIVRPNVDIMRQLQTLDAESTDKARDVWFEQGGYTMLEHAIIKMCRGQIDPRDVQQVHPIHISKQRYDAIKDRVE